MIKYFEIDECDCDILDNYGVKCNIYFFLFVVLFKFVMVEVICDSGDWINFIVNFN